MEFKGAAGGLGQKHNGKNWSRAITFPFKCPVKQKDESCQTELDQSDGLNTAPNKTETIEKRRHSVGKNVRPYDWYK